MHTTLNTGLLVLLLLTMSAGLYGQEPSETPRFLQTPEEKGQAGPVIHRSGSDATIPGDVSSPWPTLTCLAVGVLFYAPL